MLEYNVSNNKELAAAVLASAQPSYAEARSNPVHIHFGSTVYSFKQGITHQRAYQLVANIRKIQRHGNV